MKKGLLVILFLLVFISFSCLSFVSATPLYSWDCSQITSSTTSCSSGWPFITGASQSVRCCYSGTGVSVVSCNGLTLQKTSCGTTQGCNEQGCVAGHSCFSSTGSFVGYLPNGESCPEVSQPHTLTINVYNQGVVSINVDEQPEGSCGDYTNGEHRECIISVGDGASVELSADHGPVSWTEDCISAANGGGCSFVMTGDKRATITFGSSTTPTCTDGIKNGVETGVDCGGTCPACPVNPVCPNGICENGETPVNCLADCHPYKLTVYGINPGGTGSGITTGVVKGTTSPRVIDNSPGGVGQVYMPSLPTYVVLSATETSQAFFTGWSGGGCSGTGTCEVYVDSYKTVNAIFKPLCKETDWTSTLGTCRLNAQTQTWKQTKTWTKTNPNCLTDRPNSVNHPATETVDCVPVLPTDWELRINFQGVGFGGVYSYIDESYISQDGLIKCKDKNNWVTQDCVKNYNFASVYLKAIPIVAGNYKFVNWVYPKNPDGSPIVCEQGQTSPICKFTPNVNDFAGYTTRPTLSLIAYFDCETSKDYCQDVDGDGYGNPATKVSGRFCNDADAEKAGYINNCGDCDDNINAFSFCNPSDISQLDCCDTGSSPRYKWGVNGTCSTIAVDRKSCTDAIYNAYTNLCSNPVFAACGFCTHPDATRQCGFDSACEASTKTEVQMSQTQGFQKVNNKWVFNGYTKSDGNTEYCGNTKQCVISTFNVAPNIISGKDFYIFMPGGNSIFNIDSFLGAGYLTRTDYCNNALQAGFPEDYRCNLRLSDFTKNNYYFNPNAESMIINSRYGEFEKSGFQKFLDICNKVGANPLKGYWQTDCVIKDKCKDGGNNDGYKNLFQIAPYKNWIKGVNGEVQDTSGNKIKLNAANSLMVRLKDVDNPACRQYCYDGDVDGFCGTAADYTKQTGKGDFSTAYLESTYFKDCDDNPNDDLSYNSPYWQIMFQRILVNVPCSVVDASGKYQSGGVPTGGWFGGNLGNDFLYGDWDDGNQDFRLNGIFRPDKNTVLASPNNYCWIKAARKKIGGVLLDSSYVHPFMNFPANSDVCTLNLDTNCNKGGKSGYDFNSLVYDSVTPFDNDISTGNELYANEGTSSGKLVNVDYACWQGPGYGLYTLERLWPGTAGIVLMVGVIALAPVSPFIGTAALAIGGVSVGVSFTENLFQLFKEADETGKMSPYTAIKLGVDLGNLALLLPAARKVGKKPTDPCCPKKPVIETPPGGCFLAGTKILMENGSYINIENITTEDRVVAYDIENNRAENVSVTETFVRNSSGYFIIKYKLKDSGEDL